MNKTYKTDHVKLELQDGILLAEYFSVLIVDLELAKTIVKERYAFTDGKQYPILLDVGHTTELTREARIYWASDEASKDILAGAIITRNSVNRMIANVWLQVNKPKVPTKLFSPNQKEQAISWLKKVSKS
jgi:hypothetical protein